MAEDFCFLCFQPPKNKFCQSSTNNTLWNNPWQLVGMELNVLDIQFCYFSYLLQQPGIMFSGWLNVSLDKSSECNISRTLWGIFLKLCKKCPRWLTDKLIILWRSKVNVATVICIFQQENWPENWRLTFTCGVQKSLWIYILWGRTTVRFLTTVKGVLQPGVYLLQQESYVRNSCQLLTAMHPTNLILFTSFHKIQNKTRRPIIICPNLIGFANFHVQTTPALLFDPPLYFDCLVVYLALAYDCQWEFFKMQNFRLGSNQFPIQKLIITISFQLSLKMNIVIWVIQTSLMTFSDLAYSMLYLSTIAKPTFHTSKNCFRSQTDQLCVKLKVAAPKSILILTSPFKAFNNLNKCNRVLF